MTRFHAALCGTVIACAVMAGMPAAAQVEPSAALREGALLVHTTTDTVEAVDLLAGFRQHYPGIAVTYVKMDSTALYEGFLAEAAASGGTADILWSSAMDLQVKLVNDGFAASYLSPEAASLPAWAVWRHQAYAITDEPVAFVYNRTLMAGHAMPSSHAQLLQALRTQPDFWTGRIAAYDPEHSGTGFLFLTQDIAFTSHSWDLLRAMGRADVRLYGNTSTMLDRVANGDVLLAYDVLGAYAMERAKSDDRLGVILPTDYTLMLSRIAFVPRAARHPNAARLFLDYMLSAEGQTQLAARSLAPVRADARRVIASGFEESPLCAIEVGPELLTFLDQSKRATFIKQWRKSLGGDR